MPDGYSQAGIELLYQQLAQRGISPAAAAGAISGVMGEAGPNLSPTAFNTKDPGGGSGGIGQWNRNRLVGQNGLLAFAQNAGVPNINVNTPTDAKKVPLAVQAQYLGHELDTTYSGVASQLRGATSPQQALNIWVNDYEDPADKAAAIAQRSQYLNPVFARVSNPAVQVASAPGGLPAAYAAIRPPPAAQASGPIDPSIIARGGVSPPIPASSSPAAPVAGPLATGGGSVLPGFPDASTSNQFTQGLEKAFPGLGGQGGQGGGQEPMRASPMLAGPGIRNMGNPAMAARQVWGQTLNSIRAPGGQGAGDVPALAQWGSASPGQAPYANIGQQGEQQAAPYGTSLSSQQMAYGLSPFQLQMLMNPMMLNQMGGGYG